MQIYTTAEQWVRVLFVVRRLHNEAAVALQLVAMGVTVAPARES